MLVTIAVLADGQLGATDDDGALGHHDIAGEDAGLLELIVRTIVRLDVHGLGAVGALGVRQQWQRQHSRHQQGGKNTRSHKA
ncbi:hypothetical protein D3C72_2169080 [compost metagenome]